MNIHIIIADNHQLFIDGIKSILSNEIGISSIKEASNGLELIKLIDKYPKTDIILTNIRMPIIDGIAATKILSKEHPNIPVLALSMYDQSTDILEMLNAGAKGYVTKNIEKKELICAIHTLIKGECYFGKNLPKDILDRFKNGNCCIKSSLTRRETEILNLLAKGRTTLQMASQLKLSKFTIDTHRKNIHKKLGIKSNTGLVRYALKNLNFKV